MGVEWVESGFGGSGRSEPDPVDSGRVGMTNTTLSAFAKCELGLRTVNAIEVQSRGHAGSDAPLRCEYSSICVGIRGVGVRMSAV